ncbi:MAG TPA: hypothetical protein VK388_18495 [Pyrinomonadaceae bacterium]|nr:hypothetical protein [Pyrinomonadaceae bacterium]
MQETQKFFEPTPVERDETIVHEPDGTLSTPRFDAVEAQVARPVVPLAGRPARSGRRQWPIALVLISALAGGVVSLLAFRLYQQRQQTQAVATEVDGQAVAADTTQQSSEPATAQQEEEQQAQSDAPVVFEEFDPAKEGGVSDATPSRPKVTVEAAAAPPARRDEARDETRAEAKPAPRAADPKPRLVETLPAPRQVEARHEDARRDDRAEDEDFSDRRRERRRQRREQRREQRRNIDRIKDIFEGAPPS